ncbi:uncharacterized protein BT62DRAFT_959698 [Guyanagaster necrorhizus]|uniref:Uncharacterized protein n=1 Tax=Guyanagaster necrorhizus TaxID=856835 RepID=A0A9P7W367_9AGAR|nr:uncharacterized protein BT62DRAFT_959698 [Guyanagaster necrorhizus MCA 3950]KAG7451802.1 hypothetical protein BT62DRAFT_959698 [Guyanagaster necrorhizus MCA 3950]
MLFSFFLVSIPIVLAQQHNAEPTVDGSCDDGWQSFPNVTDATAYPNWIIDEELGAYMPVYQTTGLNASEVTRAVIILHGKERTCWTDWNAANNALYNATYDDSTIERDEISILSPCFFDEDDLEAGAAQDGQLLWGKRTWMSGHRNVAPDSISDFSSFDVLDALVDYYMNTTLYPNLKVVVVAGHSAGGQMSQRYAALRISTENDDQLHFWIANPASLLWLTSDRPVPNDDCKGFDRYKYGLASKYPAYATANARVLGREGIIERYNGRTLNYAWGLKDNGDGDTRCQAMTQGSTHLKRGKNFVSMLEDMGGIPNLTTIDWVPKVRHDTEKMMASDAGVDKLFRYMGNSTDA